MKKRFKADEKELYNTEEFFLSELSEIMTDELENEVHILIEEIFINIARYAYDNVDEKDVDYEYPYVDIDIEISPDKSFFTIVFEDKGYPFDPLAKPDPDMEEYIKARRIGGLGIVILKKFSDSVVYSRDAGRNILTITKKM